jgi:hypothetical protein
VIRAALAAVLCGGLFVQSTQQPPRDPLLRRTPADQASVSGAVTSDETPPRKLRRVLVTLNGAALDQGGRTVITDDEGRFTFDSLPPGQYGLTAHKDGYVAARYGSRLRAPRFVNVRTMGVTGLSVARGEAVTADIRMARGAVVTGVITDADGRPEQGVSVGASSYGFAPGANERRLLAAGYLATTDDRGVYRIYGIPAGEYVISAQRGAGGAQQAIKQSSTDARSVTAAPVYFPSTTDETIATRIRLSSGEERTGVDIQMRYVPTATVAGVVAMPPGSLYGRVSLSRATGEPGSVEITAATSARADGAFTLTGVVPGHYRLNAMAETPPPAASHSGSPIGTWLMGSVDVDVDGDDLAGLAIPMSPTLSLSGTLRFDGVTPPGVRLGRMTLPIAPIGNGYGIPRPIFQPLDDSHFTISNVIPGAYRLIGANAPGIRTPVANWWLTSILVAGREALDGPVEIRQPTDDVVVTVSDRASIASGSVRDAHGSPVAGVYVVIFGADRASWFFNSRRVAGVRTDGQGRYTIRNLPPGEYRAAVALDLQQGEWFEPDVIESLQASAIPFAIAGVETKTIDLILR